MVQLVPIGGYSVIYLLEYALAYTQWYALTCPRWGILSFILLGRLSPIHWDMH